MKIYMLVYKCATKSAKFFACICVVSITISLLASLAGCSSEKQQMPAQEAAGKIAEKSGQRDKQTAENKSSDTKNVNLPDKVDMAAKSLLDGLDFEPGIDRNKVAVYLLSQTGSAIWLKVDELYKYPTNETLKLIKYDFSSGAVEKTIDIKKLGLNGAEIKSAVETDDAVWLSGIRDLAGEAGINGFIGRFDLEKQKITINKVSDDKIFNLMFTPELWRKGQQVMGIWLSKKNTQTEILQLNKDNIKTLKTLAARPFMPSLLNLSYNDTAILSYLSADEKLHGIYPAENKVEELSYIDKLDLKQGDRLFPCGDDAILLVPNARMFYYDYYYVDSKTESVFPIPELTSRLETFYSVTVAYDRLLLVGRDSESHQALYYILKIKVKANEGLTYELSQIKFEGLQDCLTHVFAKIGDDLYFCGQDRLNKSLHWRKLVA